MALLYGLTRLGGVVLLLLLLALAVQGEVRVPVALDRFGGVGSSDEGEPELDDAVLVAGDESCESPNLVQAFWESFRKNRDVSLCCTWLEDDLTDVLLLFRENGPA